MKRHQNNNFARMMRKCILFSRRPHMKLVVQHCPRSVLVTIGHSRTANSKHQECVGKRPRAMPAVLRGHDFEFGGHILWCDFCTPADGYQCGIWGGLEAMSASCHLESPFSSVPTGIEVEVPSETLLVDSPLFKCLACVARVFSKVIFMSMCVFVFELCQEALRY